MEQAELKKRMDELYTPEFEKLAIKTLREQGREALDALADREIEKYRTKWLAAEPAKISPEVQVLRDAFEATLTARLKAGSTTPISQEADSHEWRKNPDLRKEFFDSYESYLAFSKANASGRIKIAGGKIIR